VIRGVPLISRDNVLGSWAYGNFLFVLGICVDSHHTLFYPHVTGSIVVVSMPPFFPSAFHVMPPERDLLEKGDWVGRIRSRLYERSI
jgi:hypothetical protein